MFDHEKNRLQKEVDSAYRRGFNEGYRRAQIDKGLNDYISTIVFAILIALIILAVFS